MRLFRGDDVHKSVHASRLRAQHAGHMDEQPAQAHGRIFDESAAAASLVDAANAMGGVDNITVVLMRFETNKKNKTKDDNA